MINSIINRFVNTITPLLPLSFVRMIANRYIAGESSHEALKIVQGLNDKGFSATLDILGEHAKNKSEAKSITDEYAILYEKIQNQNLDCNISIKPTHIGLDMGKVVGLAEKVMSPEGAIELAANLQVLGGAAGDLADPFKLMYMATNDLEGLQDTLIGAGRDLAIFNEETGRIEIPPTSIRQIGALASELDMTREEFVRMMEQQPQILHPILSQTPQMERWMSMPQT